MALITKSHLGHSPCIQIPLRRIAKIQTEKYVKKSKKAD